MKGEHPSPECGEAAATQLDPADPRPLYRQLLAELRRRILDGSFDGDGRLPSEAAIERSYGVSRITVRRALQELAQLGLIERRQGRATRVAQRRVVRPTEAELDTELANILSMGFQTEPQSLEIGEEPATEEIAQRLGLAPGTPVSRLLRLRRMAGRPFCRSLAYLPRELAERYPRDALEREPLLLLLVRAGVVVRRVEQTVAAVPASGELAALLEVEPGAPLLLIERLLRDGDDRPVELVFLHFRADRYRYGISFRTAVDGEQPGAHVESLDVVDGS